MLRRTLRTSKETIDAVRNQHSTEQLRDSGAYMDELCDDGNIGVSA